MKTRQKKMEEDKTRQEETHHKRKGQKRAKQMGECQEQGDKTEDRGNRKEEVG